MMVLLLLVSIASLSYAGDNRTIDQLEAIRAHFDTHIRRASNHHERAVIFDNAVQDIEPLDIDESLKNETYKHCINAINIIEQDLLDKIVLTAPKVAESIKKIDSIDGEKHRLLAQVDDLENAQRAARASAKEYITKVFDDRKKVLAGSVGAGAIAAPEEVKRHAHEQVVSVHAQQNTLDQLVIQFYTDINNKRLNSRDMQHKLDVLITHINDLSGVSDADKERAIKDATQAAQAHLQEHGQKLPPRGAPAKQKRPLKGRVMHSEEEVKREEATPRTQKAKPKSGESVTQEAARLRRERAAQRAAE